MRLRLGPYRRALTEIPALRTTGVDVLVYLKALGVLVRNPVIMLGPFLAALIAKLLGMMIPSMSAGPIGSLNAGIAGLIAQLLASVGLAVAIIGADYAWRRGRTSFDEMWGDAQRRFGDILMAAIGFNFVLWAAAQIGLFVAQAAGNLILLAIALFFFIYTMPAGAIGGIPGGAALQVSVERARANPVPTIGVFLVFVLAYFAESFAGYKLLFFLISLGLQNSLLVSALVTAIVQTLFSTYVAIVMAKVYSDIAYGRRWY